MNCANSIETGRVKTKKQTPHSQTLQNAGNVFRPSVMQTATLSKVVRERLDLSVLERAFRIAHKWTKTITETSFGDLFNLSVRAQESSSR
jgi:hypothetical protein